MYYQEEADKKERRKIIAVATAAVALILILLVAIIVVATKKTRPSVSTGENTTFEISETTESEDTTVATEEVETESSILGGFSTETEETEETESEDETTETTVAVETTSDIADTGPEEILPLALVLGSLTTCAVSAKMVKENQ